MTRAVALARRASFALGIALGASAMSSCSSQVEWKEEVPLNTGETIWVTRTARYERALTGPLALELGWRLEDESLKFEWGGKNYRHTASLSKQPRPILLFIDVDQRQPVLVAPLGDPTQYGCRKPHYGEYRFQGGVWRIQEKLSTMTFGARSNLMIHRPGTPQPTLGVVSAESRERADWPYQVQFGYPPLKTIDPSYVTDTCKGKV